MVTNSLACLGDKEKEMKIIDSLWMAAFFTVVVYLARNLADLIDMLVRLILHD
jgi:hypothetical protein